MAKMGGLIHWLGIALILFVCFFDVIMGKEVNQLAGRAYAAILVGLAAAIIGSILSSKGKK